MNYSATNHCMDQRDVILMDQRDVISDIDLRQIGACCACSQCWTFLFAPLMVIVLWPQYREKIAQHMLRAIAVLHFPICALKSCPAPAALAAGAGHYFSLTAYNLTF